MQTFLSNVIVSVMVIMMAPPSATNHSVHCHTHPHAIINSAEATAADFAISLRSKLTMVAVMTTYSSSEINKLRYLFKVDFAGVFCFVDVVA